MPTTILGISAFYHDSAAALVIDGQVVFAVQEERFSRKKHDPSFPVHAVKSCLDFHKKNGGDKNSPIGDLAAVAFYDKPFLKFERLLETYYAFAPRGLRQFLSAIPVWIREKAYLKKLILDELQKLEPIDKESVTLLFPEHHLSHAASAFYPSPFEESAILTIDGVGEWATASIAHGKGRDIKILSELRFPHSLGLLYSAFTYYTGFKVNSGEYKLMGLAPYGDPTSGRVRKFMDLIYSHLLDVKEDGSIWVNQHYFNYSVGLRMVDESKWETLFGFPRRESETEVTQDYCDMALAIQNVTEDVVSKMANTAKRRTGSGNLCMAGGVALNCVANGKLLKSEIFRNLWFQPAAGDAGGAVGAALAAYHIYFAGARHPDSSMDAMKGAYLGPEYPALEVEAMAAEHDAVFQRYEEEDLYEKVAELLDSEFIVGWHQGRMEWGPRALGNRSILADARNPEMQKKLNLKIKYRESFRPFAPSVLIESAGEYFDGGYPSPYMLLIDSVNKARRRRLPEGYHTRDLKDKLYFIRSDIPAVTHLDYSARVQTVHKETNPRYHRLIEAFQKRTGYGIIVNTSFNVRGEPIVCTPEDAYKCFMRTEMDYLVIGNFLFDKKKQPEWQEPEDWRKRYELD
ncbi:MAG: carbamoyltransferase [Syntrophobacteraceae bacterium]|jgi:carbamoyltransferase